MTMSPIAQQVVRVLLIEDNAADVDLIKEALEDAALLSGLGGPGFELEHVGRLQDAVERIGSGPVDIVLLDLSLPDSHGFDTFLRLEQTAPSIPIVVLSGLQDEDMAVRAVREGAQDYLVKGQVDGVTLTRAIRYAVERKHAVDERAQLARASAEAAASLRARDETLAMISHDLRTPLTSIRGFAQIIQRRLASGAPIDVGELTQRLGRIEEQTVLMARMIDDLLDVAHIEAGRPLELRRERCDLAAIARKAVADVQRTTDQHRLREFVTEPEIVGEVDGARLERVILNLLTNAVKYSPEGGNIDLTLSREDAAQPSDGSPEQREWAILTVQDQGIGIPEGDIPRIFQRFYRASNVSEQIRGTGLGLAGARQVVEQHGGEISVRSQPSVGTTFTVRIPL